MPLPTPEDQHVDQLLTNVSVAYLQAQDKFVADRVFPRVAVQKQSGKFATYNEGDFLRDEAKLRGPGSESAGGGYNVSTGTYSCEIYASHIDVDDQTVANADVPFRPAQDATQLLTQRELIKREVRWAAKYFTPGVWTGGTSADPTAASLSGAWDNPSSTPIEDIHDQINAINTNSGFMPNTLVLNLLGWQALKNHPDLVDRVKHTSGAALTTDVVARLLGIDRILVTTAVYNTAGEGATASYSSIAGANALLVYSAPSPSLMVPSGGYTFVWSGYPGGAEGRVIRRFRMEHLRSERVEIEAAWDQKVVAGNVGVYIQSVAS